MNRQNNKNIAKTFSWGNPEDLKIFDLDIAKHKAIDFLRNLSIVDIQLGSHTDYTIHHLVRKLETIKKITTFISHPDSKIHNLSATWLATGSVAQLKFWFNGRECVHVFRVKSYIDSNGVMIDKMHELLGKLLALGIVNTIAKAFEIEVNNKSNIMSLKTADMQEAKIALQEVVEDVIKTVASKEMRHMLMSPVLHPDYNTNNEWLYSFDEEKEIPLKQELINVKERCNKSIDMLADTMLMSSTHYLDKETGIEIYVDGFIERCKKEPYSISTTEIMDLLCDEYLEDYSAFDIGHILELFHQVFLFKVRDFEFCNGILMTYMSECCDDLRALTPKTPEHCLIDSFENEYLF